jgi:penicillin-binding protein 2
MWGVVNEGGTGTSARVEGFDVAGKTGTAQVVNKSIYKKGGENEDHAWFLGFAPYRNPEIVVAVLVEHGGHGGEAAAPIAHAVFQTYYKKKTGHFGDTTAGKVAGLMNTP